MRVVLRQACRVHTIRYSGMFHCAKYAFAVSTSHGTVVGGGVDREGGPVVFVRERGKASDQRAVQNAGAANQGGGVSKSSKNTHIQIPAASFLGVGVKRTHIHVVPHHPKKKHRRRRRWPYSVWNGCVFGEMAVHECRRPLKPIAVLIPDVRVFGMIVISWEMLPLDRGLNAQHCCTMYASRCAEQTSMGPVRTQQLFVGGKWEKP